MSDNIARNAVYHIIENNVLEGTLICDESTLSDLGLDSFSIIEICIEVEEELNLFINDDDFVHCETVGDMIKFIDKEYKKQIG